ncbi:Helicase domain protein [Desulfamplus magnetovallimortis]|uniref:Helicase domain protein n=1 Tax=Desulfamplus magnetovallimortis TaxID=1246637 RepID=A0A1W1HHH7_9BACT|nr:helicase-related protein [Desulfamplus magnetovallimortis]SLM31875.1 Helicase domain protein [Desulfamplus magnetovallimortis]
MKKGKRYIPPSSAGFSFFITGEHILLRVYYDAVCYKKIPEQERDDRGQFLPRQWEKIPLSDGGVEVEFSPESQVQHIVFNGKARIDALWRRYRTGYIVTITMSNNQNIDDEKNGKEFIEEQNEKTLFNVVLHAIVESGQVGIYPSKNRAFLTDEEKEVALRYKDLHIYAVGHGAAADWAFNKQGKMEIKVDFIPTVEVPQLTASTGSGDDTPLIFAFLKMCEGEKHHEILHSLTLFVSNYAGWIEAQSRRAAHEDDEEDKKTAQSIIEKQHLAHNRMRRGVELLQKSRNARIAFATMNRAMLLQWISNDRNRGIEKKESQYRWRPFQLAFILMVLESVVNEESQYRDTLDLIWFPTGGGKTEAYLGVMAFLFIYRRLAYPASYGGTVAIMRYTLRLLTSQQFIRANKVISALELIRRENGELFGREPFSTGLWVGGATSPNTYYQAVKMAEDGQFNKLVISSCPWCDAPFSKKNYIAGNDRFHFTCTNPLCDFGKNPKNLLPCNIVDEALYQNPPTLLIATVDKFARLTWEERAAAFFGLNGNRPPELIVQDELHLISNALGSIVGLYEVAIDTVLITRGMRSKYIASTATIKNAKQQIRTLFGRDVAVFPPSGIRCDDSYFAKSVPLNEKPGRLYVGYLAPLLSRQRCLEPLAAILLSAPIEVFGDMEAHMDRWWTQIVYHGSLKGVGNSRTLYQSGIPYLLERVTVENLKNEIEKFFPGFTDDKKLVTIDDFNRVADVEVKGIVEKYPLRDLNVNVLTSNQSAVENNQVFMALEKGRGESGAVDVALATNMISVGLDVSRLAMMIINGQPLTTAEYIQASSRVGRGETPGIVFVNYYKTQARSLSHYENFRSYHDAFYRFVEPSSLTPFTYQARSRALHAALIIALRYGNIGLLTNDSAGEFDRDNQAVRKVIKEMKRRCAVAVHYGQEEIERVHLHIDELVDGWRERADYCRANRIKLVFNSKDRSFDNLICNFNEENGLWPTLQSMRNVENSALVKLFGKVRREQQ